MSNMRIVGRNSTNAEKAVEVSTIGSEGSTVGLCVADVAVHPGEDSTLDRTWGGPKCSYNNATGDELIKTGAGVLYGYIVTVITATNVIELRDATSAGGGTVLISIPAATAVGTYVLPVGIEFTTGLYADFTGTGTINVLYV